METKGRVGFRSLAHLKLAAEEEVCLFNDKPRLFRTVLEFILEGYDVPREKVGK